MGAKTTKGKAKTLHVYDAATKENITIPLTSSGAIMGIVNEIRTWIKSRTRTGGKGTVLPGGFVEYSAYPKQAVDRRDIEITIDDTTGKVTNGMLGSEASSNFGYIAPTVGQKIVKDTITFEGANFIKHVFAKSDRKGTKLGELLNFFIDDNVFDLLEDNMIKLKSTYVAGFGTVGKWATDAGYVPPGAGVGLRLRAKTYAKTIAGGQEAIKDIKAILEYKESLGRKDGNEPTYPFSRGMNLSKSTLISISADINDSIGLAVESSTNGFIHGVVYSKQTQQISHISVNGKNIPVEIQTDIPARSGKQFNFAVEEVGRKGALAMPNVFKLQSKIRDHYEGNSLTHSIFEMIGLVLGMKWFQPELNWGSFEL